MPHVLKMTDTAVLIVCEYAAGDPKKKQNETEAAEQIRATICVVRCGFYRDVTLRNEQRQAQQRPALNLFCVNPDSPYLAKVKKEFGIP